MPVTLQTLCSWLSFTFCDFLDQASANHAPWAKSSLPPVFVNKVSHWNIVMPTHLQNDFFFQKQFNWARQCMVSVRDAVMSSGVRPRTPEIHEQWAEYVLFSPKIYDRDFCKYIHIYRCMFCLFPSYFPLPLTLEQLRVGTLTLHAVENPHGNYSCPSLYTFPPYSHGSDSCCSRSYTVFAECYIEK